MTGPLLFAEGDGPDTCDHGPAGPRSAGDKVPDARLGWPEKGFMPATPAVAGARGRGW